MNQRTSTPSSDPTVPASPGSASEIQPNRGSWILPDGQVLSVADKGWNEEQTAFSHGIFVRRWVRFRTAAFHPDTAEVAAAETLSRRALELLSQNPELLGEEEDNPFAGDLAYNQAAEELGWIRVKPLPRPVLDQRVYRETAREPMTPAAQALLEAVRRRGLLVRVLRGGALANRGFWIEAAGWTASPTQSWLNLIGVGDCPELPETAGPPLPWNCIDTSPPGFRLSRAHRGVASSHAPQPCRCLPDRLLPPRHHCHGAIEDRENHADGWQGTSGWFGDHAHHRQHREDHGPGWLWSHGGHRDNPSYGVEFGAHHLHGRQGPQHGVGHDPLHGHLGADDLP